MTKFIPYTVIALLIVGAVVVISGKLKNQPADETTDTQSEEQATVDSGPSAMPVSQINLDTKAAVDKAIDAELGQLDKELEGINDADFNASKLENIN